MKKKILILALLLLAVSGIHWERGEVSSPDGGNKNANDVDGPVWC